MPGLRLQSLFMFISLLDVFCTHSQPTVRQRFFFGCLADGEGVGSVGLGGVGGLRASLVDREGFGSV